MSRPLDYLTVAGIVGSETMTRIVELQAVAFLGPDYIIVPDGVELPIVALDYVEHLGTLSHHGHDVDIWHISDVLTLGRIAQRELQERGCWS